MIDWKILAAGFVALMVTASFLGNFGIGDFFSGIVDKIRGWLEDGPFKGVFSTPEKTEAQAENVYLVLYPDHYTLASDSGIELIINDEINLTGFRGLLNIDFQNREMELNESGTGLFAVLPLRGTSVMGAEFKKLGVYGMKMKMKSGDWTETSENGTTEVYGFSPIINIGPDSIEFSGNATKVVKR